MGLKKENISVDAERCTGCLNCQLICSLTYTKSFNPSLARIRIDTDSKEIAFTEDCLKGCHLCTRYCVYGAIVHHEESA